MKSQEEVHLLKDVGREVQVKDLLRSVTVFLRFWGMTQQQPNTKLRTYSTKEGVSLDEGEDEGVDKALPKSGHSHNPRIWHKIIPR